MKVYPLQKQIESMKRDFPFVKYKSDFEFHVVFPDYPNFHYKIELNQDYPKTKPQISKDGQFFKLPILTYWLPTCTLSNVIQNLYLVSMSNSNNSLIPPSSLSPPAKKTVSPLISYYDTKSKQEKANSLSLSNPICESTDMTLTELENSEISEISEIIAENDAPQKTGNEYIDSINILKVKFRKKEIGFKEFMTEFQRLQSLKDKQNV